MSASDYKDRVGLRQSTALINETTRAKLIASGRERFKNLESREGKKMSDETKEKIRQAHKKTTSEHQNENNTCEEQLIGRYHKLSKELGRRAMQDECGFKTTAKVRFGSWKNFIERCGYEPITNQHKVTKKQREIVTKHRVEEFIKDFFIKFGAYPDSYVEIKENKEYASKYLGMQWQTLWSRLKELEIKKMVKKFKSKTRKYDPSAYKGKGYTREDLTELLQNFEKNHGRLPASSDARRGLLPSVSTFHKYFGKWSDMLNEVF